MRAVLSKIPCLQLLEYYYQVINKCCTIKFENISIYIIIMFKKGTVFNFDQVATDPLLAILLM